MAHKYDPTCGCRSCATAFGEIIENAPRPEQVRGETHGDYTLMSDVAQQIKAAMRRGPNWDKMAPHLRESLELDATKVARIVCGDFSCYDHWDDRRGYIQLVLDRMAKLHV